MIEFRSNLSEAQSLDHEMDLRKKKSLMLPIKHKYLIQIKNQICIAALIEKFVSGKSTRNLQQFGLIS